jgi:hypothetical protein
MTLSKLRGFPIALILCALVSGCQPPNPADKLVGVWKREDAAVIFRFYKDGTYVFYPLNGSSMSGKFSFPDENRLRTDHLGVVKIRIDAKCFTLWDPDSHLGTRFSRLKANDEVKLPDGSSKRADDY